MVLQEVVTGTNDKGNPILTFKFSSNAKVEFDCPIGMPAVQALEVFGTFIDQIHELIQTHSKLH